MADNAAILPPMDFGSSLRYEATQWLSSMCMSLAFSLRSEGSRFIPRRGPALLVANHQSLFDPLLVGLASPRHLCYLARKTLFRNSFMAWFIRGLNAVPIDQEGIGKEGIKAILQLLHGGRAVLVFPEGHRTYDGNMQPLFPGVQLLVKKTAAPVIPIGIAGAYEAWPRWRKYPVPAPLFAFGPGIAVSIGPPLDSRRLAALPREEVLDTLLAEVQSRIARAEKLRRK